MTPFWLTFLLRFILWALPAADECASGSSDGLRVRWKRACGGIAVEDGNEVTPGAIEFETVSCVLGGKDGAGTGTTAAPQPHQTMTLERLVGAMQAVEQASAALQDSQEPGSRIDAQATDMLGRAGSDYSSDGSGRGELCDDDSLEASLYGGPDDTRLRPRKDMSVALWDAARGTSEVVVKRGKAWVATGFSRGGQHLAFIEEVVFMVEQGSLALLEGERLIPLLEAYSLVATPSHGCSWDNYQVYSYLRKLGYIVGRHNVPWTSPKKRHPPLTAQLEILSGRLSDVKVSGGAQQDDQARGTVPHGRPQGVEAQSAASGSVTEAEGPAAASLWEKRVSTSSERQERESSRSELQLVYDVHLPSARFKKSSPGVPAFSVCISSGHPPRRSQVRALAKANEGRPVKFASVICDHVTIYSFDAIELRSLP